MCVPALTVMPPILNQVTWRSTASRGASSDIHLAAAPTANRNDKPTPAMPMSAPLPGIRFPKNRMRKKQAPGMAGISQALRRKNIVWVPASALHQVGFVERDRSPVAEDEHHDRQAHADLGRSDGDDEQGEDLAGDVVAVGAEGHQVDVYGVEHELDGRQ